MAVRSLLVLSKLHNMHTQSIDFTLDFPQADIKVPIYLHTRQGIDFGNDGHNTVLMLKNNLYGLHDTGRTWSGHLSEGLIELGFHQTETDQCVFIKYDAIILVYVDDCIILSKNKQIITIILKLLRKRYTMTDEREMEDCLGIQLERTSDTIRMSQPLLMNRIIEVIHGMKRSNSVKYPVLSSVILTKDTNGEGRKEN